MSGIMDPSALNQAIHITLRGKNNITYTGTIVLKNIIRPTILNGSQNGNYSGQAEEEYDQKGASYYVIAVVLVYGMSIVMLIASHIKRRHDKIVEDKQIDRYLQDFQIVKERQARESYKSLKRSIADKLKWDKSKTYRNLHHTILPLVAVGIPGNNVNRTNSLESIHSNTSKRKVFPSSRRSSRDSCHGEQPAPMNLLHPDHAYHPPVHLTLSDDSDNRRVRFTPPPEGVQPDPDSLSAHSAVGSLRGSRILTDIIEREEPPQSEASEKDSYKGSLQDITIAIPIRGGSLCTQTDDVTPQTLRPRGNSEGHVCTQTDDVTLLARPRGHADDTTVWMQKDDSVSSSSERLLGTSPSLSPVSPRASPVPLSELGNHSPASAHIETERLLHITCV